MSQLMLKVPSATLLSILPTTFSSNNPFTSALMSCRRKCLLQDLFFWCANTKVQRNKHKTRSIYIVSYDCDCKGCVLYSGDFVSDKYPGTEKNKAQSWSRQRQQALPRSCQLTIQRHVNLLLFLLWNRAELKRG